jgi:hypothetical protein
MNKDESSAPAVGRPFNIAMSEVPTLASMIRSLSFAYRLSHLVFTRSILISAIFCLSQCSLYFLSPFLHCI